MAVFKSKTIHGSRFSMDHLDPFRFGLMVGESERFISVEFSCHCFTEALTSRHPPDFRYFHGGEARAFSIERYTLSHMLPDLIRSIGSRSVYRSQGKNYFLLRQDVHPRYPGPYVAFFNAHQSKSARVNVHMIIESAYLKPAMTDRASPVRFTTLIDRTAQGLEIPFGPPQTIKRK